MTWNSIISAIPKEWKMRLKKSDKLQIQNISIPILLSNASIKDILQVDNKSLYNMLVLQQLTVSKANIDLYNMYYDNKNGWKTA